MVRRFSKRCSKHALNSFHKSFKCDGLCKRHKNIDSHICQTLFSPSMTSMPCTKTVSRPGKASYQKSLLISHSVMEMCFPCFMNTKCECLRCELPICNKCSVFEENELSSRDTVLRAEFNASFLVLFFAINCQRKARQFASKS